MRRNRRATLSAAIGLVVLIACACQAVMSARHAGAQRLSAQTVLDLVTDMLGAPGLRDRPDARIVDMLDEASHSLDAAAGLAPAAQERMRTTIGLAYDHLGHYVSARRQFEMALAVARREYGAGDERTREAMINLEGSCFDLGDYEEALGLLGTIMPATVDRYGRKSVETARVINELGLVTLALGRPHEAEGYQREAMQTRLELLGPAHPAYAQAVHNLGAVYLRTQRHAEAEAAFRSALAILSAAPSRNTATVARYRRSLAGVLIVTGRLDEATSLCRQALEELRASVGDDHAFVAGVHRSLADIARARGDRDAEELHLRAAHERYRVAHGDRHPQTRTTLAELQSCIEGRRRARGAIGAGPSGAAVPGGEAVERASLGAPDTDNPR